MPSSPKEKQTSKRPPVVVVMGHIDHGKSTLLDYIRKENTVTREAGGITQRIGAYEAIYQDKTGVSHRLTFLDTPGHEAFYAMRGRGVKAADIAILVISGEDGVKPQTLEALRDIKESGIPYLVAINKIDRPGVDVAHIKAHLAEHEMYVEGYGGEVPCVPISAVTGEGVPELLEILSLMAELKDLTSNSSENASGIVIEAHMDHKRGSTATLIIKNGTLSLGQFLVSGKSVSSLRSIEDSNGKTLKTAGGGSPVRVVGWSELPKVGAEFLMVSSRKEAEALANTNVQTKKSAAVQNIPTSESQANLMRVVVKADTAGSLEAIEHEIGKVRVEGVNVKILSKGVGSINESDIKTASAGKDSVLIGFNVKVDTSAKALSERQQIPIITFDIIYRLTEWLSEEAQKRRPRVEVEEVIGRAQILKLFTTGKGKYVIGGRVESGSVTSGTTFKLMRREAEVSRGKVRSLQQQKLKVDEVTAGKEFGAMIESKIEPARGDVLEIFSVSVK